MPRKKTDERTEAGPRRGDCVLVEDSVVRVGGGGDDAPDLEPRLAEAGKSCRVVLVRGHAARRRGPARRRAGAVD